MTQPLDRVEVIVSADAAQAVAALRTAQQATSELATAFRLAGQQALIMGQQVAAGARMAAQALSAMARAGGRAGRGLPLPSGAGGAGTPSPPGGGGAGPFAPLVGGSRAAARQVNANLKSSMAGVAHHLAAQSIHAGYVLTHALSRPVMDAGKEAVHLANEFELQMSRVRGLTNASQAEVESFTAAIKELAPALGSSPEAMAKAMYFISSGGLTGKRALDALIVTTKASVAGLGEVEDVAFAAKAAVNAYTKQNMTAARATDVLTETVVQGKVQAAQLAPVMGRVLPIASAMGMSFEDVGGAMASLTRVGASAAQAAVGIQAMLLTLAKPSEAARDMVEGAGLSFQKLREMVKDGAGVIKVMRLLDDTFGADESAIATLIPNVRALRAALGILSQDAGVVDEVMRKVRNSAGATDRAFAVAAKTNAVKFQMALASLKVLLIEVGQAIANNLAPIFAELSFWAREVAEWFRALSPEMKRLILIAGAIAAAIAPAVFALATFSAITSFLLPTLSALIGIAPGLFVLAVALAPVVALTTGLMRRAGGWHRLGAIVLSAWAWLAPTRKALSDLASAVVTVGGVVWDVFENKVLRAFDGFAKSLTGRGLTWDRVQYAAVTALRAIEFAVLHMGDVWDAGTAGAMYYWQRFANDFVYYGSLAIRRVVDLFAAGVKEIGAATAQIAAGTALNFAKATDPFGTGTAVKAAEANVEAASQASVLAAKEMLALQNKPLSEGARPEGVIEQKLRLDFEKKNKGLLRDFLAFAARKDMEAYLEALGNVQQVVAQAMDPEYWLSGEFTNAYREAGERSGDEFSRGLKDNLKHADAALRGTAEDAARAAQYYESTLKPIEEARIARQRKLREEQLEVIRRFRVGAAGVSGSAESALAAMLTGTYLGLGKGGAGPGDLAARDSGVVESGSIVTGPDGRSYRLPDFMGPQMPGLTRGRGPILDHGVGPPLPWAGEGRGPGGGATSRDVPGLSEPLGEVVILLRQLLEEQKAANRRKRPDVLDADIR